jgi:uncharacterized phage infection (PIP) family protein YhgE
MNTLSLVLSILALAVGGVSYWRSGGKQDVAIAKQQIDEQLKQLETKQKELVDDLTATTRAAYASLQESMKRAGERLVEIRKGAAESLQEQIDLASQQLERLQKKSADALAALKDTTIAVARETEEAIAKRVRRLEARVEILHAKLHINSALSRAEENDFDKAEEYLRDAVSMLKDARQKLEGDTAYDTNLDAVADSLKQAVAAVKSRAEDVRQKIEKVVTTSDTLVSALESDEQSAHLAAQ